MNIIIVYTRILLYVCVCGKKLKKKHVTNIDIGNFLNFRVKVVGSN